MMNANISKNEAPDREQLARYVDINPEVAQALEKGIPVVALESVIIAHSPPYPQNVERAFHCEKIIRDGGAVPATMAVLRGRIKIGLTEAEIHELGQGSEADYPKMSRRDLAAILALGKNGVTTVTTTVLFAGLAGIRLVATGGIGGVHKGGEVSMDISSDLQELSRTNIAVVASGCKSILDAGRTLEYLETMGVAVLGYETDHFPNFYTRKTEFGVDYRVDDPAMVARMLKINESLGLTSGMLVANPIPYEYEMQQSEIDAAIKEAEKIADAQGIKGKEYTPFVLSEVYRITEGKNRIANIHLVYHNVEVATAIAREYGKLSH